VQDLEIVRPDQVWVVDITYIHLKTEFVYLAIIMDVYTRSIRGWYLSRTLEQDLTLTALKCALAQRTPEIHHSDQGVQYAATAYTDLLQAAGVAISMAEIGEATQNGYAERLIRTIKEEEVDLSDYLDFTDAYHQIGRFLEDVYMHKRIHSSLGYLTRSSSRASGWPNKPPARLLTKKRLFCVQFFGAQFKYLAVALGSLIESGKWPQLTLSPQPGFYLSFLVILVQVIGEEYGWRGYAIDVSRSDGMRLSLA